MKQVGGEPAGSGHLSGIQRRGWRELEERTRPKDDGTFLTAANTLRYYDQALARDLPENARETVEQHRAAVAQVLLDLRGIELLRRAG